MADQPWAQPNRAIPGLAAGGIPTGGQTTPGSSPLSLTPPGGAPTPQDMALLQAILQEAAAQQAGQPAGDQFAPGGGQQVGQAAAAPTPQDMALLQALMQGQGANTSASSQAQPSATGLQVPGAVPFNGVDTPSGAPSAVPDRPNPQELAALQALMNPGNPGAKALEGLTPQQLAGLQAAGATGLNPADPLSMAAAARLQRERLPYNPENEPFIVEMVPSPPAILAGAGLAWATIKGLQKAKQGSPTIYGTHLVQDSPLAHTIRALDHGKATGWLSNWLDNKMVPYLVQQNQGFRALNLLDRPEMHMSQRMQTEWDALSRYLGNDNALERYGTRGLVDEVLNHPNLELEKVVTGNIDLNRVNEKGLRNLPKWVHEELFAKELTEQVNQLEPKALESLVNGLKKAGVTLEDMPAGTLSKALADPEQLLQVQRSVLTGLGAEEGQTALKQLSRDVVNTAYKPSRKLGPLGQWFSQHIHPETGALSPADVQKFAVEKAQDRLNAQLEAPVKLMDVIDDIQGKGFSGIKQLFNGLDDEAYLQQSLKRLQETIPYETVLEKDASLAQRLFNYETVADKKALQSLANDLAGAFEHEAKYNKHILHRMRGFFGRTEALIENTFKPYQQDFRMLHALQDVEQFEHQRVQQLVKSLNVDEEILTQYNKLVGGSKPKSLSEAAEALTKLYAKNDDALARNAREFARQLADVATESANMKPVKGLGRLVIQVTNTLSGLITGETAASAARVGKGVLADLTQSVYKKGGWLGIPIGALFAGSMFVFAPAIHAIRKGDDAFDKTRNFVRNLVGFGILNFVGFTVARKLDGAFGLTPKILKGASSKISHWNPLSKLFKITSSGFWVEMLLGGMIMGGLFEAFGSKVVDRLIGKPNYLRREEAAAKQQQLMIQQQLQQQQALLNQLTNSPVPNPQAFQQLQQWQQQPINPLPGAAGLATPIGQAPIQNQNSRNQVHFTISPQEIMNSRPALMEAGLSAGLASQPTNWDDPMLPY